MNIRFLVLYRFLTWGQLNSGINGQFQLLILKKGIEIDKFATKKK